MIGSSPLENLSRLFGRLGEVMYMARVVLDPLDTVRYANSCEALTIANNGNRIGDFDEDNYQEENNNPSLGEKWGGIYPNPNNGNFTLTYTLKEDAILEVYNSFGQLMMIEKLKIGSNKKEIELTSTKGMYYYTIKTKEKIITNGKLVVQ